jgi:hypothetical protein
MRTLRLFLLCLLPGVLYLYSQAFSSLSGTVSDPSGAVIPGATVIITNTSTGVERSATTDNSGRYTFMQVLPGTYNLTAKAQGFTDVVIQKIELAVNSPATVPVLFEKVGAVTQTIAVEATAVQVNTQDASLGNAVGNQLVMTLPSFARNVTTLLSNQPGVTNFGSGDDRDGAVNGGKSDQANVTLDGADVNDQNGRSAFTSVLRVTLDSVQEFRTTTSNGNPDGGRGSGADVALVTKNGTNELHGSAYEYHRNTITAANSFFNNAAGVARPALLINVFGASVGGPIKKNRTFFFLNYEGRRDASATSVGRVVPTDTLRQGIVQYHNTSGQVVQLTPDMIRNIDPLGIGVDPAVLQVLNLYPHGNDNSVVTSNGTSDGLNFTGYRFNAPLRAAQNTYIARFDHQIDSAGKHMLFLRGNLQNDHGVIASSAAPQFPGQQPNSVTLANNKGMAAGYTAMLKPNVVSTFRYGFTRAGGETTGILNQSFTYLRGLDRPYGTTTGLARIVPVHNITEDLGWTHGAHDIKFGTNIRLINNGSVSYGHSWNSALTNGSGLKSFADIKPASLGVAAGDATTYNYSMTALLGLVTQGNGNYNYNLDGSVMPAGAPVVRHYKNEEYESYVQDTWKATRQLTVTLGLRYSLMPPVYEGNGFEVSADQSLGAWLDKRGGLAQQGLSQAQAGVISYVLANSAQGRPMYPYHKNWAPRLGLAYSPKAEGGLSRFLFGGPGKTSIRAGAGMFYDVIGQPLAQTYSNNAFGLSTSVGSPMNVLTAAAAPRYTGFWTIPAGIVPPAPKGGFPTVAPNIFAITGSIDDQLKAPYSMALNFSIGREFSHGIFIQGSYVGRLSRDSLIQRDLAMPTDLKDPKSGQTYFQAMTQLGQLIDFQHVSVANLPKIPFFENLWASAAGNGLTATQVMANSYLRNTQGDFTSVLNEMDEVCDPSGSTFTSAGKLNSVGCSVLGPNAMFNAQYGALSAWSSIAGGSYHAMEWTIRKRAGQNLVFDLNYTFSKSIDLSSNAERVTTFTGFVVNTWNPGQLRGVSNYDTTHQVNADFSWALPFGRGQRFGTGINGFLNALIGGWQLTGVYRQTSGLPMTISDGSRWATNWQLSTGATPNGSPLPAVTNTHNVQGQHGGPNLFSDPVAAAAAFSETMPGQSGTRNTIRGGGFFNIDTGVIKYFQMPYKESHKVSFRWETFNLTNTVMFDPRSANNAIDNTSQFGRLTSQLGSPRQMQFALRYEF